MRLETSWGPRPDDRELMMMRVLRAHAFGRTEDPCLRMANARVFRDQAEDVSCDLFCWLSLARHEARRRFTMHPCPCAARTPDEDVMIAAIRSAAALDAGLRDHHLTRLRGTPPRRALSCLTDRLGGRLAPQGSTAAAGVCVSSLLH